MIKDNFIKQATKYGWEKLAKDMDAEITLECLYSYHDILYGNSLVTFPDKSWVTVSYKGEIEYEGEEDE